MIELLGKRRHELLLRVFAQMAQRQNDAGPMFDGKVRDQRARLRRQRQVAMRAAEYDDWETRSFAVLRGFESPPDIGRIDDDHLRLLGQQAFRDANAGVRLAATANPQYGRGLGSNVGGEGETAAQFDHQRVPLLLTARSRIKNSAIEARDNSSSFGVLRC